MASAMHCQLNPQVRRFVPTAMTSKLAYSTVQYSAVQHRHGKREEGEEPVSKHQIRPGDGRWTGRRGVGRLNPRRENKIQGKNGDREGRKLKKGQGGVGQGGVGLAVRNSTTRAARPPEFISDRLLKVTLELRGRAKAVTFVVAYAPTEPKNANNKHAFWTSLVLRQGSVTGVILVGRSDSLGFHSVTRLVGF